MSKFTALFNTSDGNYFASSDSLINTLPPGLYKYNQIPTGMILMPQVIEPSKIILDELQGSVYKKILNFWRSRDKYLSHKITHKRGILLFGPPGTGKTTLLRYTIREHIAANGVVVMLNDTSEFPEAIKAIKDINGPECRILVIIEDIDESYEEELSTAIDGIGTIDNTLFIATTNFLKKVSKRLANRPSRFDEKIEMSYPNDSSRETYIEQLSPNLNREEIDFITSISNGMSQAHIKELVIQKSIYELDDVELKKLSDTFRSQCEDWEDEEED